MVPSGWKRKLLVKVAEIRTGVAKGKKGLKDPIEVPYLRVANVQDGHIDLTEIKTIEIERHQLERYSLLKGDVLMTEGGDFDKLGRGDVWQSQITPCLNQNHVFAVRVDKSEMEPYFLAALSGSHYGKTYFLSCAKRSTNLASINSTQLKQFPVLLPPLPEQRKISQVLSTWDKAICTTERLIDNSKRQKKALMQQLLTGNLRLLSDSGERFEGEWEEVHFNDVLKTLTDYTANGSFAALAENVKVYDEPNHALWIMGRTLKSGNYEEQVRYTDEQGYEFLKKTKLFGGELLMPKTGDVGKAYLLPYLNQKVTLADNVFLLDFTDQILNSFARYFINSEHFQNQLRRTMYGTSQQTIVKKELRRMQVLFPAVDEQEKIVKTLNNADKEIELLEQQLADLKQEKKGLMQQLLTGKRRVKTDAMEVA